MQKSITNKSLPITTIVELSDSSYKGLLEVVNTSI